MYFRPNVKNKKKMKMNEASQMQTLIDNSQWIDIRVDLIKSITSHNVNWQFQLQVAFIINVHMGRTYLWFQIILHRLWQPTNKMKQSPSASSCSSSGDDKSQNWKLERTHPPLKLTGHWMSSNVLNRNGTGIDLISFLIRNLQLELLLQSHNNLDIVQAIQA